MHSILHFSFNISKIFGIKTGLNCPDALISALSGKICHIWYVHFFPSKKSEKERHVYSNTVLIQYGLEDRYQVYPVLQHSKCFAWCLCCCFFINWCSIVSWTQYGHTEVVRQLRLQCFKETEIRKTRNRGSKLLAICCVVGTGSSADPLSQLGAKLLVGAGPVSAGPQCLSPAASA